MSSLSSQNDFQKRTKKSRGKMCLCDMCQRIRSGGQIMNKKLLLLPILLTSPLFFMANSPAPAAFPIERYYDFRVDSFSQNDEKNERGYYDFSITIDNFGDNYLLFTNGEFTVKDKYDNYGYTTTENPSDCAINPGKSRTVFGESSVKLNTDELEFVSNVYSSPYQASYDSVTFADKSVNSDGSYDYRFSVNNLKLDDEYYHSFIVDYSYLGEDRSFDIQYT